MENLIFKTYVVYSGNKEINYIFQFSEENLIGKISLSAGPKSVPKALEGIVGTGGVALLHIDNFKKYLESRFKNSEELYEECLKLMGETQ